MIREKDKNNQHHVVLTNGEIAHYLEEVAELLEAQHANPFRVHAYRLGAQTVRALNLPVSYILEKDGIEGLRRLPNIGISLARTIEQLEHSGKLGLLERLRGETGRI